MDGLVAFRFVRHGVRRFVRMPCRQSGGTTAIPARRFQEDHGDHGEGEMALRAALGRIGGDPWIECWESPCRPIDLGDFLSGHRGSRAGPVLKISRPNQHGRRQSAPGRLSLRGAITTHRLSRWACAEIRSGTLNRIATSLSLLAMTARACVSGQPETDLVDRSAALLVAMSG